MPDQPALFELDHPGLLPMWLHIRLSHQAERVLDRKKNNWTWLRLTVVCDAGGAWWAGYSWNGEVIEPPYGAGGCGSSSGLAYQADTREAALSLAAAACRKSLLQDATKRIAAGRQRYRLVALVEPFIRSEGNDA